MLTVKQHERLLFINKRLNDFGVSPSFDEMREALDLKSKSGVHRLTDRRFLRVLSASELSGPLRRKHLSPHSERTAVVLPLAWRSPPQLRGMCCAFT